MLECLMYTKLTPLTFSITMNYCVCISLLCCFLYGNIRAQSPIPVGTWRDHLPLNYNNIAITSNAEQVIMASPNGATIYRFSDGTLEPFSRIDGLSAVDITDVQYNDAGDLAIVTYKSGGIDFIKDNTILPLDAILRAGITGSKTINHIAIFGQEAFLSTDFGVVVLNLNRLEVKETWRNLSADGSQNRVYQTCLTGDRDSVFLATEAGVLAARYTPGVNLLDYANWFLHGAAQSIPIGAAYVIGAHNGVIYTAFKDNDIFYWNGLNWTGMGAALFDGWPVVTMVPTNSGLRLCMQFRVYTITSPSQFSFINSSEWIKVNDVTQDRTGNLWMADSEKGLIRIMGTTTTFYPQSTPLTAACFKLTYSNQTILVNTGGYNGSFFQNFSYKGFYTYDYTNGWKYNVPQLLGEAGDNVCAFYPTNSDSIYIGTWSNGLFSWHRTNGGFVSTRAASSFLETDFIGGLDMDKNGTLWIGCSKGGLGVPSVFSKKGNTIQAYALSQNQGRYIIDLKIDPQSNKWMRYGNPGIPRGLMVFNENGMQQRYFSSATGVPGNVVTCVEVDRKGDIWIGTDEGLAGFSDPTNVFSTGTFYTPIFNGFPILFDKQITCIKADGGNRKWVGTTDGLWLFNDDFTEAIAFYSMDNAPLPSNFIVDIAIHEITGEVFIGTDKGIISYRSDANASEEALSSIKIYPNPVLPGYQGLITVEGLTDNAIVKFTDMQGKLVYETRSNGGMATWNRITYKGNQPVPGVYLIFVADAEGNEGIVGKVAIIE